jgi:hypothetical protein
MATKTLFFLTGSAGGVAAAFKVAVVAKAVGWPGDSL